MRFTAKYEDEEVSVAFWDAVPTFACEAFPGKTFRSFAALEAALKAYRLSLRKGFTNPTAYLVRPYGSKLPIPVKVTTITEDGREAWISGAAKREKVALEDLFADKDEALAAIELDQRLKAEIAATWKACRRWRPEWPTAEEKEG